VSLAVPMSGAWGKPAARKETDVRDVIERFFHTRFWDKGVCETCKSETLGIFGPPAHDQFYCRKCWMSYLSAVGDAEWKEWKEYTPAERVCPSGNSRQHELKCALLALQRSGGSITFPPSLSGFDRMKVHEFCSQEPELRPLSTKSFGEGTDRFLRVTSADPARAVAEAQAILKGASEQAAENGSNSLDTGACQAEEPIPAKATPSDVKKCLQQFLEPGDIPLAQLLELQRELAVAQQLISAKVEQREKNNAAAGSSLGVGAVASDWLPPPPATSIVHAPLVPSVAVTSRQPPPPPKQAKKKDGTMDQLAQGMEALDIKEEKESGTQSDKKVTGSAMGMNVTEKHKLDGGMESQIEGSTKPTNKKQGDLQEAEKHTRHNEDEFPSLASGGNTGKKGGKKKT